MKVKDLIDHLTTFNPEAEVVQQYDGMWQNVRIEVGDATDRKSVREVSEGTEKSILDVSDPTLAHGLVYIWAG